MVGRLKMMRFSTEGPQAALTASQTWRTKLGSVSEKVSGLHSKAHSVPDVEGSSLVRGRTSFIHRVVSSRACSWKKLKTTFQKHSLVAR